MMSAADEVTTATLLIENDQDQKWMHAVHAAVMAQGGSLEPVDGESRARLLGAIRNGGYPHAELEYLPAEGSLPRICIRPGPPPDVQNP